MIDRVRKSCCSQRGRGKGKGRSWQPLGPDSLCLGAGVDVGVGVGEGGVEVGASCPLNGMNCSRQAAGGCVLVLVDPIHFRERERELQWSAPYWTALDWTVVSSASHDPLLSYNTRAHTSYLQLARIVQDAGVVGVSQPMTPPSYLNLREGFQDPSSTSR
jgi:hypothetical protein